MKTNKNQRLFKLKKNKNSNCNVLNHNPLHMVHSLFQLSEKEIFLLYVSVSSTAIVLVANLYLYWPLTVPRCLKSLSFCQRKSFDSASPKLGAAMRIAMVQIMLKTLNPTRKRRSMTAAANCHCSAKLSCRSCSRTRSTKNCTSTRRACSWPSAATDRITPLWVCRAAVLPDTTTASRPQGPEDVVDVSGSGDTEVSGGGLPNFKDGRWWWIGVFPGGPPPLSVAPSSSTPPLLTLPLLVVLLLWSDSSSAVVWKPM